METALGPLITALIKMGAPWIVTGVFIVLYIMERKAKEKLADRLYEVGMAMTKTNTEFNLTLKNVERDVDEITRRYKIP